MKSDSSSQREHKKFSVLEHLSPDNALSKNLDFIAMGKLATTARRKRIFGIVAGYNHPEGKKRAAVLLRERKRKLFAAEILKIIDAALKTGDGQPFEEFIEAVVFTKNWQYSGLLLPDYYIAACVADEMGLKPGANKIQSGRSKEFKDQVEKRLGRKIDERQFARIKKSLGLHWPSCRPTKV